MSPILLSQFATQLWSGDPQVALPGSGTAAPPGLEAFLEYNGILLHDRRVVDKYRVKGMDGLHGVEIRSNKIANPSNHGSTPLDNYLGDRTLIITGAIQAHNIDKLRDMEQALRTAFTSMTEKPLIFHMPQSSRDVYINCRIVDKISIPEAQNDLNPFRDFQLTLEATNPRWLSVLENGQIFTFGSLDDFSQDTTPNYTYISGTAGTLTVSGGQLVPTDTTEKRIWRNNLGYRPIDSRQTVKVTTTSTTGTSVVGHIIKRLDDNNFLFTNAQSTGPIEIYKRVGGVDTNISGTGGGTVAFSTSAPTWVRSYIVGNVVTVEFWTTDPSLGTGTPVATRTATLAGTDVTLFGAGVSGDLGLRVLAGNTNYRYDDYIIEPLNMNFNPVIPRNKGNFLALPRIRLYGPMTNIVVSNENAMPDENFKRTITINGSIPAGSYYEYNASRGTLVDQNGVNKYAQLDTTSRQLQLANGDNPLDIVATSSSGITPRMDVYWQDTWI